MSLRTKGHYPFLLKFNCRESFHNMLLTYNPQSWSVQFYFSLPPGIFMSGLEKISHMEIMACINPNKQYAAHMLSCHGLASWHHIMV